MINIMPDKHFFRFQQCYRNIKSTHDQFHNAVQSEFLSKNMISPWIILECVQLHLDLSCNDACGENSLKRSL